MEAILIERIDEVQNQAIEFKEMCEEAVKCDLTNIIHSAKLKRLGELHIKRAQSLIANTKGEVTKARRDANISKAHGIKNMSKAIGDPQAKPLTCVCRDQDTQDGGTKGRSPATQPMLMLSSSELGKQSITA